MNRDHHKAEPARKGGLSSASPQESDLSTDASHDRFDIGHHICHIEPKHVIPGIDENPIAPLIEPLASTVVEPIDFDDELHLGSEQIDDEPTEQRDLPPKRDSEPPTAKSVKEHLLGSGGGIGSRNGVSAAREGVRRLHIAQVRAKMPFVHRHWTGGPR